jgi:hypothetical protein
VGEARLWRNVDLRDGVGRLADRGHGRPPIFRLAPVDGFNRLRECEHRAQSWLEHVYREAMSGLVVVNDLREVAAKRELYRQLARTSDDLREVAERVWYAVLKQS